MENQSSFKMRKINNIADIKAVENDNLSLDEKNNQDNLNKKQMKKKNKKEN